MEIPAKPIIIEGEGSSPFFKILLVINTITDELFEFKYLNFTSN